jgi:Ras-related protein Rab-32
LQKVRLPNGDPLPVILLANKCDMVKTALNEEVMDQYCKENGFISWFATSAKENVNIDESVACIVNHVLKKDEQGTKDAADGFALHETPTTRTNSGGCCS